MTESIDQQLREDRALRNSARALVKADIAHIRSDLTSKGFGSRIVDRVTEGATDVFEEAVEVADNHKGVLGVLLAAILIWFARTPLASIFSDEDDDTEDDRDTLRND
ncbi:hypothetical protein HME9302_01074 [Alteripontixanthobacter maritimus]|uniref:DUF3618 domain-containing protein n=1 Tax=Alteripontixanthobacter maritimus TaxID=2161824 RepID=A0A369QC82_9SPHN|nr:hypothetical protein [Alteripontixanthobacter maritimus]RDC59878.1 hypothetical protein HME9302_01074 [Alteripontixanthobacter maritimus]